MEMKQRNFKSDNRWADKFMPDIKRICGEVFISKSDFDMDISQATDLIVLDLKDIAIACRVRIYDYYLNEAYRNQFTIRTERPNGKESEIGKILSGWCRYNFYGFSNISEDGLIQWFIGDLNVFRYEYQKAMHCMLKEKNTKIIKWHELINKDGSSAFYAFDINSFPINFIIKKSDSNKEAI